MVVDDAGSIMKANLADKAGIAAGRPERHRGRPLRGSAVLVGVPRMVLQ